MATRLHHGATLRFYKQRMLVALAHIQQNLDASLVLDDLARRAGLSPYHFHRVFRGLVGEPLMAHIRRLRLERAARHLRQTPRRVIEIALEAGYDSHEAFTRAFKQTFGFAPAEFRRCRATARTVSANGIHFGDGPHDFRATTARTMAVTIDRLPPTRVAYLRHVGPYSACGPVWARLCTWMGKEGYLGPGCRLLGVCYDDPDVVPPSRIRYDACVTVDRAFQPAAGLRVQTLAGGDYARATHFGPYEQLGKTYARLLGRWLPRSGRYARDLPCFEAYLNDPDSTAPADLITDIYLPLASP
jgi:AraC family transcriptional regulator